MNNILVTNFSVNGIITQVVSRYNVGFVVYVNRDTLSSTVSGPYTTSISGLPPLARQKVVSHGGWR